MYCRCVDTDANEGQKPICLAERCCLLLWGTYCDELVAAILVSTLRAAGLCVCLVGVSGRQITGRYGLRLQPDLTLAEALSLVQQASCLVIPCDHRLFARLINDPRVDELVKRALQAQIQFVVSPELSAQPAGLAPYNLAGALAYPPQDASLFAFAAALAVRLSAR